MVSDSVVYIVDDDEAVRISIEALLKANRYQTQSFASAEQFLAADIPQGSCCLVIDVRLPGMSGIELMEKLAASDRSEPTLLISGFQDHELEQRAHELGAMLMMEKPCDPVDLLDAIAAAIDAANDT